MAGAGPDQYLLMGIFVELPIIIKIYNQQPVRKLVLYAAQLQLS